MLLEKRIIIAGAGEAGVAAAAALRANNYGGEIVLVSEEGQLPYERPPLSKASLQVGPQEEALIRPETWYSEQSVTLLRSSAVVALDAASKSAAIRGNGEVRALRYDSLLIATGSRPRRLPGDHVNVHYLRTQADARRLRDAFASSRHIVIIGGGVIGLEVAATARGLGLTVTVIDPAERLMARAVAPEVSAFLLDLHRDAGVNFVLDSGPLEILEESARTIVRVSGAEFHADACLAGIGALPNDELGRMAGCAVDNGILVDGCGRTTVPGIFAAGDVAVFRHPLYQRALRVEAWQHAGRHGAHVGRAMIGVPDDYSEVPWFWTDQYGVNVQVAGLPSDCNETVWRGDGRQRSGFHLRDGALCGVTTIDNGRDMRPAINLLAARWSGDPAELCNAHSSFREISRRLVEREEARPLSPDEGPERDEKSVAA